MASLNKAMIIGNLGKDPDTRYMPNGSAVTAFSVATNEKWKDKQTGEEKEQVEWHRVVLFGRIAEVAAEYLKKGSSVYIEGKMQTRKWDDKDGVTRYTTEIVGREMKMLGTKGSGGPPHPAEGGAKQKPAATTPQQGQQPLKDPFDTEGNVTTGEAPPPDFDDDIPF